MPKVIFNQYIWLVNTLSERPKTFRELRDAYHDSPLYEPMKSLSERTLFNWRQKIEAIFHVRIVPDRHNRYSVRLNAGERASANMGWLAQSLYVNELLHDSPGLAGRVVLEKPPKGFAEAQFVMRAMTDGLCVSFADPADDGGSEHPDIIVAPLCLRVFGGEWLMLAERGGVLKVYALSGLGGVRLGGRAGALPKDFDIEAAWAEAGY